MALEVIVIGAGLGGLAAAIALRQAGHKVTILERRSGNSEVGYAIEIPPNASRILKTLGIQLTKIRGCRQTGIDIFDATLSTIRLKRSEERPNNDSEPFINVHRQDYWQVLKDTALSEDGPGEPVLFRGGCQVVDLDADEGSVTLNSGETLTANLLVASDGNQSVAHRSVIGEERLPQYTGISNVRFTLQTNKLIECAGMDGFVDRGRSGRACGYNDFKGNFIMHYPCRDGTLQNFGIYDMGTGNRGNTPSDNRIQSSKAVARERIRNMNSSIKTLIDLADENTMYHWHLVDRDPLPQMYKGKLVLIGDANHPMRSTMGQGAAQAVEDGAVLGLLLQNVDSPNAIPTRLQLWEDQRMPRASALQLMSRTSPLIEGWPAETDKRKAEKYFPKGDLPLTRDEMTKYAYTFDALAEARKAFERSSKN